MPSNSKSRPKQVRLALAYKYPSSVCHARRQQLLTKCSWKVGQRLHRSFVWILKAIMPSKRLQWLPGSNSRESPDLVISSVTPSAAPMSHPGRKAATQPRNLLRPWLKNTAALNARTSHVCHIHRRVPPPLQPSQLPATSPNTPRTSATLRSRYPCLHSCCLPTLYMVINFFLADCCMAQRLRCPGGRPSVSYEWVKMSQNHWI